MIEAALRKEMRILSLSSDAISGYNATIASMIAICPICDESVSVYFDEKPLSDECVSVWHFSRPEDHHWKLDKEASASLRDEFKKAQARSKQKARRLKRFKW